MTGTQEQSHRARPAVIPMGSKYWQEGPRKVGWRSVTVSLLVLYFVAIGYAVYSGLKLSELRPGIRAGVVLTGFAISVIPTLFWWRQTWHFETWVRENPLGLDEKELTFERDRFKTNSDFARTFWTALIIVFTGLLVTSNR